MQCSFIQTSTVWADSACSIHPDTHDGVDSDDVKRRVRKEEKAFKSARERLREVIEQAWDGPQTEVVAEIKAIAEPHVQRLESGALRIDYQALARHRKELLAFQDSLRAEYQKRLALEQDDEDVMILAPWAF